MIRPGPSIFNEERSRINKDHINEAAGQR